MTDMTEIPTWKARAYRDLLALILDEMPAATNRDLACDGSVGDEEEHVWAKISDLALHIRRGVSPTGGRLPDGNRPGGRRVTDQSEPVNPAGEAPARRSEERHG